MKTKVIKTITVLLISTGTLWAQDIPQSQVPSVVINKFKKEFPKAEDVEWEMKGEQYHVEFEIGWTKDFEAWLSADGKLLRYEEDISESEMPKAVKKAIQNQYPDYRIDDVEKKVSNNVETYEVELERGEEEIKVLFSKNGKKI